MKLFYLIQTFKDPEQIYRLVQTIKKSSPASFILISHDFNVCDLDITPLQDLSEVVVLKLAGTGGRGDFSMNQGYWDAIDWVFNHQIEFDWLINLSGQDYPTQPLPKIEKFLAETNYDGFLEYFEVFSSQSPWGLKEGFDRYLYQYWRSGVYLSLWQRILLKPLRSIINNIQPFLRIWWSYDGLMLGVRATSTPFNENFICYGGNYYHALSRKCVQFLYDFTKQNPHIAEYYRNSCVPNESFIQTVLVNSQSFNFCKDNKRYIDFSDKNTHGSPRILTTEDYPTLIKDDIHFARKFTQNSEILDLLDARILQG
jgi:hypothetical protein